MSRRDARRDRDVAALLSARAFVEIRYLAGQARRNPEDHSPEEVLDRIRFLANLCHKMYDGEQVGTMIAVLPETFTALPSALARREQVWLVNLARNTERDTYLWGRDHETECGPDQCGYTSEPRSPAEDAGTSNHASTAETSDG